MAQPFTIKINPISPYTSGLAKYMGKKGLKAMTGIEHITNKGDTLVSSLIINKNNKFFAIELWKTKQSGGVE